MWFLVCPRMFYNDGFNAAKPHRQQESGSRYQVPDFPNPIVDTALSPWPFAVIIYPAPSFAQKTQLFRIKVLNRKEKLSYLL
jgi:hypothetical protein